MYSSAKCVYATFLKFHMHENVQLLLTDPCDLELDEQKYYVT